MGLNINFTAILEDRVVVDIVVVVDNVVDNIVVLVHINNAVATSAASCSCSNFCHGFHVSMEGRNAVDLRINSVSAQGGEDSLFGRNLIVVHDQAFQSVLSDVSRLPIEFVNGNPVDVQGGFVSPKDGLGDNPRIPMDTDVFSCLVETHSEGYIGLLGTVEYANHGVNKSNGVFVVLDAMKVNSTRIDQFQIRVIDGVVGILGENTGIIVS